MSKSSHPSNNSKSTQQFVQKTQVHSSILPPASEMEKLQNIDPRLVDIHTLILLISSMHTK
ncbi:hypothetical protein [Francisella hispaniensis]|uniref:Uncharacterized protein n=1 Tax=Francisella hispaniensis TaxID=622488 RepID=F4BJI2_9GAMM|nr:hypothetical protein [Francisella hispaniensis]AEB28326.1 hypothetical protein FN3523_0469 [Francisella hispaniensis]